MNDDILNLLEDKPQSTAKVVEKIDGIAQITNSSIRSTTAEKPKVIVKIPQATEADFWKFVYDRQEIWHKRFVLKQPAPWTTDPILRDYKFTNVMREMDRNSIYCMEHVLNKPNTTQMDKLFNVFLFRVFNRIETYEAIGFITVDNYDEEAIRQILNKLKLEGKSIFTSAYMTNGLLYGAAILFKTDKYLKTLTSIYENINDIFICVKEQTPKQFVQMMCSYPGIAEFLAYEFYCDLVYIPNLTQNNINTWVNVGPGAKRGLKRIFPDLKGKQFEEKIWEMWQNHQTRFKELGLDFKYYNGQPLNLRTIEHGCCEFFKYHRYKNGGQRPRVKFKVVSKNTLYQD